MCLREHAHQPENIDTATLFGLDVYVASDSYRPGKSTWLKCTLQMQWLQQSYFLTHFLFCHVNVINGWNSSHMFQDATLLPLSPLANVIYAGPFLKCSTLQNQLNLSPSFYNYIIPM